jgi:hypothetical protein
MFAHPIFSPFSAANVLRICEPTGPSCCTARLEAQLEQLEKLQLEEGIRSQLRLVRRFLQKTATNFRGPFFLKNNLF